MTTTNWKTYEELTEEQKAEVREIIRRRWIADTKAERKYFPRAWAELTETIELLNENDETTRAMIEDNCEPDNTMYIEALEQLEAER